MKKKNLFIAVSLFAFIFISASLIYINNVFLPQKVKAKLISGLEEYFQQKVEIQRLRYNLFKGLVIQGLSVYDKVKDADHTTLEAGEISFNPLFLPLVKNKIIIPVIWIDSPKIYLKYLPDKALNIQNLIAKKAEVAPIKMVHPYSQNTHTRREDSIHR